MSESITLVKKEKKYKRTWSSDSVKSYTEMCIKLNKLYNVQELQTYYDGINIHFAYSHTIAINAKIVLTSEQEEFVKSKQ